MAMGAVPGKHLVAFRGLEAYDESLKEAENAATAPAHPSYRRMRLLSAAETPP